MSHDILMLLAGETRGAAPLNIFGDEVHVKLAGSDTQLSCAVLENRTRPQCGPPLHRHGREDEWFYVLEGEYLFEVDGKQVRAGAGCSLYAPRGTAHTFQNVGTTAGRMIVMVQPAGLECFFAELDGATRGMQEPDLAVVVPIFEKHGLELLGPPLGARAAQLDAAGDPVR